MPQELPTQEAITAGSSFAFFPKLADELRLMVWKHALSEPRILAPNCARQDCTNSRLVKIDDPIPTALLHTCFESRQLTRDIYSEIYPGAYMDLSSDRLRVFGEEYMDFQFKSKYVERTVGEFWLPRVQLLQFGALPPPLRYGYDREGIPSPYHSRLSWAAYIEYLVEITFWRMDALKHIAIEGENVGANPLYEGIDGLREGKTSDLSGIADELYKAHMEDGSTEKAEAFKPYVRKALSGIFVTFIRDPGVQHWVRPSESYRDVEANEQKQWITFYYLRTPLDRAI
ncbi:hypothetical protein HYALB_00006028 [Hymenoscyphus albidus]|uniref:2EXR domain-containing protein n=1 Tax=Hymenoscyphus albidus TaxID=595503 RepID=A0A9N9Q1N9_9HELO|nr:hypothetical protein HYALB_00006028 [Hymenoscyphus albidus]